VPDILRTMFQHVKALLHFGPLSQYICSRCGAILKETSTSIDVLEIREDCPNCGANLSVSLKRRSEIKTRLDVPKLQTAFDLTRFKLDIEKLSSFPLGTTGTVCIIGYKANLLLTRICVRALLSAKHGGLDSPFVLVVDAGNKSDFYQTVDFLRQYGMDIQGNLERIVVSRTFTIHQLKSLLSRELPKVIQQYQARIVIIPGLLDLFEDPNIKKKEAKLVIGRIMKSLESISGKVLVITSLQPGKYADLVATEFDKRISLDRERQKIQAALYDQGRRRQLVLTERELRTISYKD